MQKKVFSFYLTNSTRHSLYENIPLHNISFTTEPEVDKAFKVVKIVTCSLGSVYNDNNKYTTTPIAAISFTHS